MPQENRRDEYEQENLMGLLMIAEHRKIVNAAQLTREELINALVAYDRL